MKTLPYLEKLAKESVDKANQEKADILIMIDGFITDIEALHLRDMLWYARVSGVTVHFVPKEETINSVLVNGQSVQVIEYPKK